MKKIKRKKTKKKYKAEICVSGKSVVNLIEKIAKASPGNIFLGPGFSKTHKKELDTH